MTPREIQGPLHNIRPNGRTEIGYTSIDGIECVVKFRRIEDLQRELKGWMALTLNGYKTVDFFNLSSFQGRPCAVMPTILLPLVYDLCKSNAEHEIVQCFESTGKQFQEALGHSIDTSIEREANSAYFKGRQLKLQQSIVEIQNRLGTDLLTNPLTVNGITVGPIGPMLESALRVTEGINDLPVEQLTITHGDPGDLNIFNNGTIIDYEVSGANDPISELATALHWQVFNGPTLAPRYHPNAYPSYLEGSVRESQVLSETEGQYELKQRLEHRVAAAREILKWYGPASILAKKKSLEGCFAERFNFYWN